MSKPKAAPRPNTQGPTQAQVAMLFGTPLATHLWPDSAALNAGLAELVRREAAAADPEAPAWQGSGNLLLAGGPGLGLLAERIRQMAEGLTRSLLADGQGRALAFQLDARGSLIRAGGHQPVQARPDCLWAGSYCVAAPELARAGEDAGKLELLDPRPGIAMPGLPGNALEARCLIDPLPGLMVLFPGWLRQMVHPFQGRGERIAIGFGLRVQEAAATPAFGG